MPVIFNNIIKGLRIHLEKEYKLDTTDIWFSSSKEYMGTNAKNELLILIPNNKKHLKLINNSKEEIVIASEMLLAYKTYSVFNKITIGLPSTISKKQATEIVENINIEKATIFLDRHTMFTVPFPIYRNLLDKIDEDKKKIKMIFKDADFAEINKQYNINAA